MSPERHHHRGNRLFLKRYGDIAWDGLIRGTIVVGIGLVPLAIHYPYIASLVGFFLVTIWVNGPISFLFPAVYEPILMSYGRLVAPILVAFVGTAGTVYIEFFNYRLYQTVLATRYLTVARKGKMSRWIVSSFSKAPFAVLVLCSIALPYWPARIASALTGYSLHRHLLATAVGRMPRLWFFAALGATWDIEIKYILMITVTLVIAAILKALATPQKHEPGQTMNR